MDKAPPRLLAEADLGETKAKLLESAFRRLAREGYAALSMREIARDAGVNDIGSRDLAAQDYAQDLAQDREDDDLRAADERDDLEADANDDFGGDNDSDFA